MIIKAFRQVCFLCVTFATISIYLWFFIVRWLAFPFFIFPDHRSSFIYFFAALAMLAYSNALLLMRAVVPCCILHASTSHFKGKWQKEHVWHERTRALYWEVKTTGPMGSGMGCWVYCGCHASFTHISVVLYSVLCSVNALVITTGTIDDWCHQLKIPWTPLCFHPNLLLGAVAPFSCRLYGSETQAIDHSHSICHKGCGWTTR